MAQSKFSLRQTFVCPLFGNPKDLGLTQLPTYEDVLRCCAHERRSLGIDSGGNREPSFSIIVEGVANKVISLYGEASIPSVSYTRVVQLITEYHKKYRKVIKYTYKAGKSSALQKKIDCFKATANYLFDIAACKCRDFQSCSCPKDRKVLQKEQSFLLDQRGDRVGRIGGVDIPETIKLMNRANRHKKIQNIYAGVPTSEDEPSSSISQQPLLCLSESEISESESSDFDDPYSAPSKPSQMRVNLKETALTSQRYGVSDRATAMIATSVLKDVGLVSPDASELVTDRSKIRREKYKIREQVKLQAQQHATPPRGLYFDGRRDDTLTQVKQGAKLYRCTVA